MPVRVVNDSGFKFGCIPGRVPPRALTGTFILKGTFKLAQGKPAEPLPEDDQLDLNGDQHFGDDPRRSIRSPSDFALFKPAADVLLCGHACAPRGKPLRQMLVALEVGKLRKELAVFGDRIWKPGIFSSSVSEPQGFERMPLDWEHALGGPSSARNPLGRGLEAMPVEGVGLVHFAANIENPRAIIRSASSREEPVGFLPLHPGWPQRHSKVGTYKGKWLRERWPWMPDDFDWSYFNAAPADQQVQGFLKGDEAVVLEGMHPDKPRQEFQLPGLRPLWFVREKGKDGKTGPLLPVPLQLDTLWIDADEGLLTLTWRGLHEIRSLKMREIVEHFMLVESLAEPPRELAYYEALYKRRCEEIEKADAEMEPGPEPFVVESAALPDESWIKPFEERMAAIEKQAMQGGDPGELAQMERAIRQKAATPNTLRSLDPKAAVIPTEAQDLAAIRQSEQSVLTALSKPAQAKLPPGAIDDVLKQAKAWEAMIEKDVAAALAKVPGANQAPEQEGPGGLEDQPWTRERVQAHHKAGGKFKDMDLSKLDLSELDLEGADFGQCELAGASFRQARLAKASFRGAMLEAADFSEAQCAEADFSGADCASAIFKLAVLQAAKFQDADAALAKFAGADLRRAVARDADFTQGDFTQVKAAGADFTYCNFTQCQAVKADFNGANLTDADFDRAQCMQADFSQCILTRFRGSGGNFTEARFAQSQGEEPAMDEANLERADLTQARWPRVLFTASNLKFARLEGGDFREAQAAEAVLDGAQCAQTNFFQATLESAHLLGSDFRGANLYGVEFWQCMVEGARFEGADMKGTKLA